MSPVVPQLPVEQHEEKVVRRVPPRDTSIAQRIRDRVRREDAKLEHGTIRDINGETVTDPFTVIRVPAPKPQTEVRIRFQDLGDGTAIVDMRDFAALARTTIPSGQNPHPAR